MICAVYKSLKKEATYLYVERRDDFSRVPSPLLDIFGRPQFVMLLPLKVDKQLAFVDAEQLRQALQTQGYLLQLPPPEENLLKQHRQQLGLDCIG
ncbi:MAG: YcgL domain-containing protein [Aeromonadaceae bacterium]|nr:YcgL domain-containing protein [Aeromonadaceae bacterium]MBP8773187.1 YcgL domain-containing protein [Aeromonadaceae bacterium]